MTLTLPPIDTQNHLITGRSLEALLGDLRNLPLMPATAQQATAMIQEENANVRDLCNLLERDVALATNILKLANSPAFNWSHAVDNLNTAVVRLGMRECQNLILAVSLRNVFNNAAPATKEICTVLWRHCFVTATLCRRLNREMRLGFRGEEFAAGLLHDLGRILLAVIVPQQFQAADPMDFLEDPEIQQRENDVLGTDHCQVGSMYAANNGLPVGIAAVIQFHHQIDDDPDQRDLVALVAAADHMANHLQRGEEPETYDAALNRGIEFLCREWSSERRDAFGQNLPALLAETTEITP